MKQKKNKVTYFRAHTEGLGLEAHYGSNARRVRQREGEDVKHIKGGWDQAG